MPSKLPYVNQPGSMVKILEKVREAQTPERFTGDFLQTKLGFRGGNHQQFIPLAKKLGLLGSDGRPSDIYKSFRNDASSKAAMAQALKIGYRELFERNEHADALGRDQFKGLVVEITGLESKNRIVQLVVSTFESLKKLADFDAPAVQTAKEGTEQADETDSKARERGELDLNLSYTINLVLPKSDDPAVFTAIFKSLRESLLRK